MHLKKTDFLSTTIAPHLGERVSWAPPYSMLECWVAGMLCWPSWSCASNHSCYERLNVTSENTNACEATSPHILSCLTKSWIQPLPYKELIDWLKFSIFITLTEGLTPKSSSSGKGCGGYLSVLYDNKMAFNMQTNTCCCNSPTPHPQPSFPMEGFDCIFSGLIL